MSPSEVVQAQFDAYNAHDLAAFLATYSDTAVLEPIASTNPPLCGKTAIGELYGSKVFNLPGHRAELVGRLACGNKVIDHERVFGLRPQPFEVIAVYQVGGGLIEHVWFFSAD
jgi:hypothetical protein